MRCQADCAIFSVDAVQAPTAGPSGLTELLASPLAKAALAGIAAMVVKRVMQGPVR